MTKPWAHPELGVFRFTDPEWTTTVRLPAYKRFIYREFRRNSGRSTVELGFSLPHFDTSDRPTKPAVTVALRVVRNQELLANKLEKAIWLDLNGKGRNTGMWWHSDLPGFDRTFTEPYGTDLKQTLQTRESVRRVIGEPSIHIVESVYGYDRPCAKLSFSAAFDPEHGVGVLTDGNKILGVGYGYDVGLYKM